MNVGVAAHITAAAIAGPRYDASLTIVERRGATNAIWLCQNCGKLVDNDPPRYPRELLRQWKRDAENEALNKIGMPIARTQRLRKDVLLRAEEEVRRNLRLKAHMRADFLKPVSERDWSRERRPYEKFANHEVIIHSAAGNDVYPDIDDGPGISTWFKVDLWDFYFNGLEVILGVVHGIVGEDGYWAQIDYGEAFDTNRFREMKMFQLGRIPWRNIVAYDIDGDEYYGFPHLYCRFADRGPYEAIVHRLIDEQFDWLLDPKKQITPKPKDLRRSSKGEHA